MIIDVRNIGDGSGHISEEHDVRVDDVFGDESTVRCRVEADYRQTGSACYISGTVNGVYRSPCHRCLEPVDVPVAGEFDAVIRRSADQADVRGDDGEQDYMVLGPGEHEVDLGPAIDENFVVNIPMLIVCREDCKGLCPNCGTNLNSETCNCTVSADSRWEALRSLGDRRHTSEE